MTIKPNYSMAFAKTFAWAFVVVAVLATVAPYFQGKGFRVGDGVAMGAFAGILFGIFAAVIFTPREVTWDEETIRIRTLFRWSGDVMWRQLEAWSPYGRGTFLIKFEGMQTFQISSAGFRSKDWKAFRSFLQERYPGKKTLFWFGVSPVRFGKRDDA